MMTRKDYVATAEILKNFGDNVESNFPDFLDLLIVCVDAGLSLNAALDRVTIEFYARSKPLATTN